MYTVLLIDDDQDILDFYQTVLAGAGYSLVLAASTAQARKQIESCKPDLAVVDVMMDNGLPGFDLVREIHVKYPDTALLMVSALNQEFKEPMTFAPDERLPIRKFLDKPVKAEALRREISEALADRAKGK